MSSGHEQLSRHIGFRSTQADKVWNVPKSWSLEEAATVPLVYLTVYLGLIIRAGMKQGQKVLIHSGSGGIGIAAPQIGISKQVAIIELPEQSDRYQEVQKTPLLVIINPILTVLDNKKKGHWEGCLSVPGLRGFVERPQKIKVHIIATHHVIGWVFNFIHSFKKFLFTDTDFFQIARFLIPHSSRFFAKPLEIFTSTVHT